MAGSRVEKKLSALRMPKRASLIQLPRRASIFASRRRCIGVAAELGTKHRDVEHRRSMPWEKVPEFVVSLREPNLRRLPVTALVEQGLGDEGSAMPANGQTDC